MSSRYPLPGATERKSAGSILPQLIVRNAIGKKILARIADIKTPAVCVIIIVPSRTWLGIVTQGLDWCAPGALVQEIRSGRLSRIGEKIADLLEALGDGRSVIAVTPEPELMARDLLAAVDHVIEIERLEVGLVRKAITMVTGQRVRGLDQSDVDGIDPVAIMAAIRNCNKAREAVERIRQLRTHLSAPQISDAVPGLEQLPLVGEVRDWADGMAHDLEAVARGSLPISAIRYGVLEGPPGTGKSLLAEALAKSSGWHFHGSSIGDWFNSGDGHLGDVTRAATAFIDTLLASENTIGLLDELQSIPNRATLQTKAREWWIPVVDNLLIQIDRARKSGRKVLLLGACNHFELLDAALIRGGRLETRISVRPPNTLEEAREVLNFYCGTRLPSEALDAIANLTVGLAPANIESGVRQAEGLARRDGRELSIEDLQTAFGLDIPLEVEALWPIALHEAAHAVVGMKLGGEVVSASILPSGGSKGAVAVDWGDEPTTRERLEASIKVGLAGRAADELLGLGASAGAGTDLAHATRLLMGGRYELGLYDRLAVSTGHGTGHDDQWLEDQMRRLMGEVRHLVRENRHVIEQLAEVLIAKKLLRAKDLRALMGAKP